MAEVSSTTFMHRDSSENDNSVNGSAVVSKTNFNSLNSTGSGSASSSPRVSRMRSHSSPIKKLESPQEEDNYMKTRESEGEKFDSLKKKMKDKDKKGFFSGMSLLNIFTPPHHHKNNELHKIFTSLPASEKLIDYYSCALQRDILIHGRVYITQSWICFYANIFSWETLLTIPFRSVQAITKEKTALIIPNAIQISTVSEKYGFSSLVNRDVTFNVVFKCWQNSLLEQPMSPLDLVKAARKAYGESTDVGSECDLWGEDKSCVDGNTAVSKQMPMPTHLEIGQITPSSATSDFSKTIPHTHHQSFSMDASQDKVEAIYMCGSVPDNLNMKGFDGGVPSLDLDDDAEVSPPPVISHQAMATCDAVVEAGRGEQPSSKCDVPSKSLTMQFDTSSISLQASDYLDMGSLGGESMGSLEYETVSLIEETGEVPCSCSEHVGRTIINDIYNTDVETIFTLLFTDSDFIRNFNKAEKTINVEMGEWQALPDNSRIRDLSYTVALNYSFGPKFTRTNEHQIYSKSGQPGMRHVVNTEVVNQNIPYGDTFYTACRYCLTRVAHDKTRVRITANIKFKKTCWGLVKHLIERNAGDGLRTHYTHLDAVLKEHVAALPDQYRLAHQRASRRSVNSAKKRHKRPSPITKPPLVSSPYEAEASRPIDGTPVISTTPCKDRPINSNISEKFDLGSTDSSKKAGSLPRVNLALTLLLGVLIVSNMLLYYHLMSYGMGPAGQTLIPPLSSPSDTKHKPELPTSAHFGGDSEKVLPSMEGEWPTSMEEWQKLFQQYVSLQSKKNNHLRDVLYSLLQTLENIESSIGSAKKMLLVHINDLSEESSAPFKSVYERSQEPIKPSCPDEPIKLNRTEF